MVGADQAGTAADRAADLILPELVVEAPPSLADTAARIRGLDPRLLTGSVRLTGLQPPGPPVTVVVAPEDGPLGQAVPGWVAGYAQGATDRIVVFPARTVSYPDSSLEELVAHEVAHVMVHRAARGRPLPRWFHEGTAVVAGAEWGIDDRGRLSLALVVEGDVSLADLDAAFAAGGSRARRAYAVAGALVRDLLRSHGSDATARILEGVRHGLAFDDAFARVTGLSPPAARQAFWRRHALWYRWVPLLTSGVTLWMGVTLLALWAFRRRRVRDAAIRRRWEEEERRWSAGREEAADDEPAAAADVSAGGGRSAASGGSSRAAGEEQRRAGDRGTPDS